MRRVWQRGVAAIVTATAVGGLSVELAAAPRDAPVQSRPASGKLTLAPFDLTPFPYRGDIPEANRPFLDITQGDRRGHTSPRGGVLWEDQTYSDRHVLLFIPKGFSLERPATLVLFLHGNLATVARDVVGRQRVPAQLVASGLNAVLVAPQFAVDALDSSAGHFWEPGTLERFLDEAAGRLAALYGDDGAGPAFRDMRVVIVAYSGGYLPAAFSLQWGGAESRIAGVVLLDALFGETDKFADWIRRRHADAFFVSAFSQTSRAENVALRARLGQAGIASAATLPAHLDKGSVVFIDATGADHNGFVTQAWTASPLAAVLSRLPKPPSEAGQAPQSGATPTRPARRSGVTESGAAFPGRKGSAYGTLSPRPFDTGAKPPGPEAPPSP